MTVEAPPLEPDVLQALRHLGLRTPDPEDPLHKRLVTALRLTRGESWGNQLVAIRFEFNWAHKDAGKRFAQARTDYENYVLQEKDRLVDEGMAVSKAALKTEASEVASTLRTEYRAAEQEERALRLFLSTVQAALDNHRTDRADWRAADIEHGRTGT